MRTILPLESKTMLRFTAVICWIVCFLVFFAFTNNTIMAQAPNPKLLGRVPSCLLAAHPQLIRELDLSESQIAKFKVIKKELEAAIEKIRRDSTSEMDYYTDAIQNLYELSQRSMIDLLDFRQKSRMQQFYLQVNSSDALLDKEVAKELKLTPEQVAKIQSVQSASQREMHQESAKWQTLPDTEYAAKVDEHIEKRERSLRAILSGVQNEAFVVLKGAPIELDANLEDPINVSKYLLTRRSRPRQNEILNFALRADANRTQRKTLVKSPLQSSSEPAIAGPFEFEPHQIRRVMIADRSYTNMAWGKSGKSLFLFGSHLTRVEYSDAMSIDAFELENTSEFIGFSGENILITRAGGYQMGAIDSALTQIHSQLAANEPATFFGSAEANCFFAKPNESDLPYLFFCDANREPTSKLLDLTDSGRFSKPVCIHVAPDGKNVFACGEKIARFVMKAGELKLEDSTNATWVRDTVPEILPGSDGRILTVVTKRIRGKTLTTSVAIFSANNLSQSYNADVDDIVTCMCYDRRRKRLLLGGVKGIWEWKSGNLALIPFPRNAPSVRSMAMAPNENTLAVLCGFGMRSRLFLVEFN